MKTFSITDVGMVRQVNQDYVFTTGKPLGILPEPVRGSGWYGWPSGRRLCFQVYGGSDDQRDCEERG